MQFVVCIKQVRDVAAISEMLSHTPHSVAIKAEEMIDLLEKTPGMMNPEDKHALEAALQLRDAFGGEVVCVSVGREDAIGALKKAMAMGADRAELWTTQELDVSGSADVLATIVKERTQADLILCAELSVDASTHQLPALLASRLGMPYLNGICDISIEDQKLRVRRKLPEEIALYRLSLPAVLSISPHANEPRYPSVMGIVRFSGEKIPAQIRVEAAPEEMIKGKFFFTKTQEWTLLDNERDIEWIACEDADEKADQLLKKLNRRGIL